MKKASLLSLILALCLGIAKLSAQTEISIDEAAQYIDQDTEVILSATIAEVSPYKSLTYFNLEAAYPNQKMVLIIYDERLALFKDLLLFQNLVGQKIKVRGKITDYKDDGKPQMVLQFPNQIELGEN